MMQTVAERGKYWYSYSEYLLASLLVSYCCTCFKDHSCIKRRSKRLKRHKYAYEKLANEIDIVKLLYVQRVGQFIAKLFLRKHQRALVTNFKKFQLKNLDTKKATSSVEVAREDQESKLIAENATV